MPHVLSVNTGARMDFNAATLDHTGIAKRPVTGPVHVHAPESGSGVEGDFVADTKNHGGELKAVYAYAREDLDAWSAELGRDLAPGLFGENLTTEGMDLTGALLGERWRVGTAVLQVTGPRIPCSTFARIMERDGWVKAFTAKATPGAYFRVLEPGLIAAGDEAVLLDRPGHDVTIGLTFRAVTLEPALLPRLLDAGDHLPENLRDRVERRLAGKPA
ncbi:MOSC domain-containing protein [Saccharothrix mutabilis subsp. mutabilis]|uniref:MOSC domain-containing protein n=1 Tax=Saccharothrix mutabilis subsp. mutabilis TaxID=66855 RepID=A0ABN0U014_9PSEU